MKLNAALGLLVYCLSGVDAVVTLKLVSIYGLQGEANPLMRAAIRVSPWFFLTVKAVLTAVAVEYFLRTSVPKSFATRVLLVGAAIYLLVDAWGLLQLLW